MLIQLDFFFFKLSMRKPLKKEAEVSKKTPNNKLKGISFPLSSTQQWYRVSNSTIIYFIEWKIKPAIQVVNNLFSRSNDPLQGQHWLSSFGIRLIKTVLLIFFLVESACFSWNL